MLEDLLEVVKDVIVVGRSNEDNQISRRHPHHLLNGYDDITDCKKIECLSSVYRIRIGDRRALFVLYIEIEDDLVMFEYLVNRGEAYDRKNMQKLRNKDCRFFLPPQYKQSF